MRDHVKVAAMGSSQVASQVLGGPGLDDAAEGLRLECELKYHNARIQRRQVPGQSGEQHRRNGPTQPDGGHGRRLHVQAWFSSQVKVPLP